VEYLIGIGLAVLVCAFARLAGFDGDRVFYPTLLVVVASYYILFAVIAASVPAVGWESLISAAFLTLAVLGFKKNLWVVAAGLAGHGVFDWFHHRIVENPGVPAWWPGFCLSFDVLAGSILAMLLMRRSALASKA
jgi:hypothetical protein